LLAAAGAAGGCAVGDEDPERGPLPDARPELLGAAERTLAAGPAAMSATLRARSVRYRLTGRLDPRRGYRFCGSVREARRGFPHGLLIWLEERRGLYETLTAGKNRCDPRVVWLDDHPPTLDLGRREPAGGEDFLHAALAAVAALPRVAGPSGAFEGCGSSECIRAPVDFAALARSPGVRDEDRWTLFPFLRRLGSQPVTFGLDPDGYLDRVVLAPRGQHRRVALSVTLGDFGEEAPVPHVVASAIE